MLPLPQNNLEVRFSLLFYVKLDGIKTLKATSGCNLHGIWSSTVTV